MVDNNDEIAEIVVDQLIRRFLNIPNTDERELGHRLESRRTMLEWWVKDILKDNDVHVIQAEEGQV